MVRVLTRSMIVGLLAGFVLLSPAWGAEKVLFFVEQIGKDLVEVQVMVEPGASPHTYEPKPPQLKKLIDHAREHNIKVVFAQPQFSVKSAEVVAEGIGGQVAVADPLALNWAENPRNVAAKFKSAVR